MSTPAPARVARLARREWGPLYAAVRDGVAERRWRAVPVTLAAVCLTALLQFTQNQPWGYQFVQNIGSVRAEDPLWLALLRTPLSLFVPALDLPVWGALAQILLVFGIAEICVGRWRTLAGRLRRHARRARSTRAWASRGAPDHPLGLPASDAQVVDTGPSAAVVGLAVYVCWRYRAWLTAGLVIAAMVVEVLHQEQPGRQGAPRGDRGGAGRLCACSTVLQRRERASSGSAVLPPDQVLNLAARARPAAVVAEGAQAGAGAGPGPVAVEAPGPGRVRAGPAGWRPPARQRDDHADHGGPQPCPWPARSGRRRS